IDEIRQQKAQYINIDPRPVVDGDFAVVGLESLEGVAGDPGKTDEMVLEIGAKETFEAFTENLRGLTPGDEKEFEVVYPEDYGSEKLAGKTVKFHAVLKGLRRKELPEIDDEFAQEIGDYRTVDELKEAVRKALFAQRQNEKRVEQRLLAMAEQGIDPRKLQLDWDKVKESQREKAIREVKASMLL